MKQWIGRLLCRDGMEDILDHDLPTTHDESVHDILETKLFHEFLGPDGKPFFRPGGGQYAFSLCMDGFNLYHLKEAGKKVHVGGVYMVCLNLPPEIHYDFKNLFLVGIIPGPGAPLLEQINHILQPLVDDLLVFWNPGVYYASTPKCPNGHCVLCAVIPLICDLPAACQMSGHAYFSSHHFCSMCLLRLEDINNLDRSDWARRTCQENRFWAQKWQNATSEKERKSIYDKYGLQWSELLRLPYWDPILFTLVDSMHAMFLGDFKRHCRDIWGMDIKLKDGDGTWIDPGAAAKFDGDSDGLLQSAWDTLRHGTTNDLEKVTRTVLQWLCCDTQMLPEPRYINKKKHLLKKLEQYIHAVIFEHPFLE